jgi:Poly(R)-hydroxyalkanoic acid synthase subunit (PHA_synth_III_E)
MTEEPPQSDPWSSTVAQMQQELLQRWIKLSAAPADGSAMFDWWPKITAATASGLPPSFEQLGAVWELYFNLGRAMLQESNGADGKPADLASRARSFAAGMDTWFKQLGAQLSQGANFRPPPDGQLWWQTLMQAPGAWAPAAGPKGAPTEFAALGLTRERQEAMQKFSRLLAQLQEVQTKLAAQWLKIGAETSKKFAARVSVTGTQASGGSMASIKGLYDLWIECAEEVYGGIAHSPEYCQLIAELANSSNAVRAEQQRELESWARQFDLPTRAEVNSLHQQVKQLRAQLRSQAPPPPSRPPTPKKKRSVRRRPRAPK